MFVIFNTVFQSYTVLINSVLEELYSSGTALMFRKRLVIGIAPLLKILGNLSK